MSMDVELTEWAFQSYLDLKHKRVFTKTEYQKTLRPNAELLKDGWPSAHAEFTNSRFWGPCTDRSGNTIQHGFKMKWRQIGSGRVQLRLLIVLLNGKAYMCESYVKKNEATDKIFMAKVKNRIRDIAKGTYQKRGLL